MKPTEPGRVYAPFPWSKEGLRQYRHRHPEVIARIEAAIPSDCYLVLAAGGKRGRYGIWTGILYSNVTGEVARSEESNSLPGALEGAIYAGREAVNA